MIRPDIPVLILTDRILSASLLHVRSISDFQFHTVVVTLPFVLPHTPFKPPSLYPDTEKEKEI